MGSKKSIQVAEHRCKKCNSTLLGGEETVKKSYDSSNPKMVHLFPRKNARILEIFSEVSSSVPDQYDDSNYIRIESRFYVNVLCTNCGHISNKLSYYDFSKTVYI